MKERLRSERGSGSEAEGGRKGEGRKREKRREREGGQISPPFF